MARHRECRDGPGLMPGLSQSILGYAYGAWRRRWLALGIAWTICLAGWATVALWPSDYRAWARLSGGPGGLPERSSEGSNRTGIPKIDTRQPSGDLTNLLWPGDNLARAARIVQSGLWSDQDIEGVHQRLERGIDVQAEGAAQFVLAYQDQDPAAAGWILEVLLTVAASPQASMAAILDLVGPPIEQTRLLGTTGDPGSELRARRSEAADLRRDLEHTSADRDQLVHRLARIPETVGLEVAAADIFDSVRRPASPAAQLAALQKSLAALRIRYAETHPRIVTVKDSIDRLAWVGAAGVTAVEGHAPSGRGLALNPIYQQTAIWLAQRTAQVARLQRRLAAAEAEIRRLDPLARIAGSGTIHPIQGESSEGAPLALHVIEPPRLTHASSGPGRILSLAGVLAAGVALGTLLAGLLGRLDHVFDSTTQLRRRFDVAVLGSITTVLTATEVRQERRGWMAMGLASLSLVGAFASLTGLEAFDLLPLLGHRVRAELFG